MATIANLAVNLTLKDTFSDGIDGANSKLRSFGQTATQIGQKLTTAVTLPIIAMGTYAVMSASNLSEAMDKTSAVFGNAASSVLQWSQSSSTSLGLSQRAALEYSSTLGNLFVAMGFTNDEAATFSMNLTTLAVDLASLNNTGVEESLIAIRAAIVGEFEPMRRFGVVMNEASIQARAMELGLWDGTGAMDAQTRTLAIMDIMYEQTGTAQGNFAQTSDQMANKTKIARAELENAAAALGMLLLPYAISAVSALTNMVEALQKLPAPVQKVIVVTALLAAALGPVLMVIGSIATGMTALGPIMTALGTGFTALGALMLANPIVAVIAAIVAIIGALYLAYQTNFLGFRDGVNAAIITIMGWVDALKGAFVDMVDWAIDGLNGLIDALNLIPGVNIPKIGGLEEIADDANAAQQEVVNLQNALTSMATGGIFAMDDRSRAAAGVGYTPYANPYNPTEGGGGSMGGIEYTPLKQLSSAFTEIETAATAASAAVDGSYTSLAQIASQAQPMALMGTTAQTSFTQTGTSAKSNLQPIGPMAQQMANALTGSAIPAFAQLNSAAQSNFNALRSVITSTTTTAANTARSQFSGMASSVTSQVSSMASQVQSRFSAMQGAISASLSAMRGAAQSAASQIASALSSGAAQAASAVQSQIGRIPGIIAGVGGSAAATAYSIGANISNSFASGMLSALGTIQAAAAQMVAAADTALRAKARIASPSKVFAQLGAYVGEGFEQGIRGTIPDAARAARDLVSIPGTPHLAAQGAGTGAYYDHRTYHISVPGAGDPDAVARRVIARMEEDYDRVGGIR